MADRPADADPAVALANPKADRVRRVRALATRSARRRAGAFLVEGPEVVREAVEHAPASVRDLYLSETVLARAGDLARLAGDRGVPLRVGTDEVLRAMSADARGAVAVVEAVATGLDRLPAAPRLVAVLANVRDPGNAGTAIRSADAAGADAIVLAGESVEALSPKVVRASAGSLFHLPVVTGVGVGEAIAALRARGLRILATDASGRTPLGGPGADSAALAEPTAWLFGNEAWGLADEDARLADAIVRVPIYGVAESLNLAASVAVCLYASAAAQRDGNTPAPGP